MTNRTMLALVLAALISFGLAAGPSLAVQPDEMLDDPQLEATARHISKQLRCVVCQNQSLDDSDAGVAKDMRLKVRELLVQGQDEASIKQYFVDRYGDYVLLKPPFDWRTAPLWLLPIILLAIAGFGLTVALRRRGRGGAPQGPAPLDASEQARLDAMMQEDSQP
jgi:cytochrome c-type biogenesis protein CcmH